MAYNKAEYIKNKNDEMAGIKNKIKELAQNYSEDPRIFSEVLQFSAKFYRYSSRNNQLIYAQNPYATFTASFKKFKEMGYNVKKGEHGMKIICPVFVTYLEDPDTKVLVKLSEASKELKEKYKNREAEIKTVQSYKLGTVFDISQTNCPTEDYPKYFNVGYKDEPAERLYNAIKKYAETKLNCPVDETDMKSISLRGLYTGTNEIKINRLLQDTQKLSTLTHELGHAIMHKDFSEKLTAQKELEADALSIMLSTHFGVELTDQRIRHLSDCFNTYKERLSEQQSEDASRKNKLDDIDKVLENVLEKFKEIIPIITETVFKELGRELPESEKGKSFSEQVDEALAGSFDRYSDLKVCDTPQILIDVGCKQLPILYSHRHLKDALKPKGSKGGNIHHHGLTAEQIKSIPIELKNPVLIYDSIMRNDSIVVATSNIDKDNCPIIAVIRPDGKAKYNLEIINSNFLLSIHGRENFMSQINRAVEMDKLLYINKERSQKLFSVLGLQLSKGFNSLDFNAIIHKSRNIVNKITIKSSDNIVIIGLYRRYNGDEFIH